MRTSSQVSSAVGFECTHGQTDSSREVVCYHERSAYQCAGTTWDLAWSLSLLRIRSKTPMLPLCAAMPLPLPIWEIRGGGGALATLRCATRPSIPEYWLKKSLTLIPRHCPGHLNVLTDHLSCRDQILKTEWTQNPAVVWRVFGVWDSSQLDRFPNRRPGKSTV